MRTLLTLLAALVAAAILLTGCASPGVLPDAVPRLSAGAAGLAVGVDTDFPDARWWQALAGQMVLARHQRAV